MCVSAYHCGYLLIMELYSLEDDDCHELFITQSDSKKDESGSKSILMDENDFQSPCVSLVSNSKANALGCDYEDISDDDFQIPSSQSTNGDGR